MEQLGLSFGRFGTQRMGGVAAASAFGILGWQMTKQSNAKGKTKPYGEQVWEEKFRAYGYGQEIPEGDMFVHDYTLPNTKDRNLSSRELLRQVAVDPADLPLMTLDEVNSLSEEPGKTIATFRGGVFDLTGFVPGHPGHDRILMANGNDLEPFWDVYKLHYRPHIQHLLQDFRIGNLSDSDAEKSRDETHFVNQFTDEPLRPRSVLRMASERPCNSGARLHEYTKQFFTPNPLYYCRNHAPVPRVDPADYVFTVSENEDIGLKETEFTLEDLKTKFKPHTVYCTMQCAGGRQEDFVLPDRPLYVEAKWREDAWGTAAWRGTKVRDILEYCGLDVDAMALGKKEMAGVYLNAYAMDESETGHPYASFIPFPKVVDPFGDVIIAWEMNGVDTPRDHGYPCRLLSPGNAGFRNVKWVEQISVTKEIGHGADQKNQHFGPEISFRGHFIPGRNGEGPTPDLMDVSAPRVVTVPVYSVISEPGMGLTIPGRSSGGKVIDTVEINGIAWAGGGRGINRVEVSIDGGNNVLPAKFIPKPPEVQAAEPPSWQGLGRVWTWQQWRIDYPLTDEMKKKLANGEKVQIHAIARARDGDFNIQPETIEDSYNVLGKCVNHWPRRVATIDPAYKEGDSEIPPHLPTPPSGQWIWSKNYAPRVDIDNPEHYQERYDAEYPHTNTPTPPKSEWW